MAYAGTSLIKRMTVLAALLSLQPGLALASDDAEAFGPPMQETIFSQDASLETAALGTEEFSHTATAQELGSSRGEGTATFSKSTIGATLSNNSAVNTVSGGNAIDGDAFSNASGVTSVIQNSGNNVVIQNSMIVNLNMDGTGQ